MDALTMSNMVDILLYATENQLGGQTSQCNLYRTAISMTFYYFLTRILPSRFKISPVPHIRIYPQAMEKNPLAFQNCLIFLNLVQFPQPLALHWYVLSLIATQQLRILQRVMNDQ